MESEKAKGKDPSRMVVGGFSQGGAVALHVCLRSTEPLAGACVMGTWNRPLLFLVLNPQVVGRASFVAFPEAQLRPGECQSLSTAV